MDAEGWPLVAIPPRVEDLVLVRPRARDLEPRLYELEQDLQSRTEGPTLSELTM